jgi:hypothetical protein
MKSLDRDFLKRQAIPIEFAGTLRLVGEYRGKCFGDRAWGKMAKGDSIQ